MLGFLKKKKRVPGLVGINLTDEGLRYAYAVRQQGQTPHLLSCQFIETTDTKEQNKSLARMVSANQIEGALCNVVLASKEYNLVLVEAPDVKPDELPQAIRWKVKELIDLPIEEVALDYFHVPDDAYRSQGDMVYVVAVRKGRIEQIRDMVSDAGLELGSIDIPEMVIKNLMDVYADDTNGLAVMNLSSSGSMLSLSKGGEVYLTRKINTSVNSEVMASADWESIKERLVLEVQRSLDYFESQMGQSHLSKLLIAPFFGDSERLVSELDAAMGVRAEMMNFKEVLSPGEELPVAMQQECLLAIGAAIREEAPQS